MDFLELVKKRKSVRKYKNKSISREKLMKCVESARLAPSACNSQPWKFIIVDESNLIQEISKKAFHTFYSVNSFVQGAKALIVVVSDKVGFQRKVAKFLKGTNYYLIDIGIACEHLILQATELGLGSCWIGWFDEKRIKNILDIPKRKKVDIVISLGYPKNSHPSFKNRKERNEIISFNKY